jgi:hypothetical protein
MVAAMATNLSTVAIVERHFGNILDFRLPQKHVLGHVMVEAGCKAGVGGARRIKQRHGAGA